MDSFVAYTIRKLPLVSFISALFIIYPNIVCIPWEWQMLPGKSEAIVYSSFFIFRFVYLWTLFFCLIRYNLGKASLMNLSKRFMHNFGISMGAYLIYLVLYWFAKSYGAHDCFGSILIFQFFVVCSICTLIGQLALLYTAQQEKELEIERLKTENLQSRCNALMNQINPHFFFNSLSGISSLIRKKDDSKTLDYVDKLSDIFRYILQSDRKGLVPLREELDFIEAFRYVMEVRFANKLAFDIQIDDHDKDRYVLPALSLLPLVDNIVVHNIIDIDHKMVISITLNKKGELIVSNPVYPKISKPKTNGTGLKNIENRFILLTNRKIKIEQADNTFKVYLPLQ